MNLIFYPSDFNLSYIKENFLGEPDFQESWLKNPKFIYIV